MHRYSQYFSWNFDDFFFRRKASWKCMRVLRGGGSFFQKLIIKNRQELHVSSVSLPSNRLAGGKRDLTSDPRQGAKVVLDSPPGSLHNELKQVNREKDLINQLRGRMHHPSAPVTHHFWYPHDAGHDTLLTHVMSCFPFTSTLPNTH